MSTRGECEYGNARLLAGQKRADMHMHGGVSCADIIKLLTERDRTLNVPVLLMPAIQVNIRAGRLPEPEANGTSYLKIPLNQF